jgi:dienelactone hydrolase
MPTITVDPVASFIDDKPTTISVTGLEAKQRFLLRLESTDAHGVAWTSSDTFRADDQGAVDVMLEHSRRRYDPMHLFNQLEPTEDPPAGGDLVYSWSPDPSSWSDPAQLQFTLTVRDVADTRGDAVPLATATVSRGAGALGELVHVEPGAAYPFGLYGLFFEPPGDATRDTALLVFGGSDGNIGPSIQVAGGLLAARGYPTLALGYFARPPSPPPWPTFPVRLSQIPLEYFRGALDWLSDRTSPAKIFVSGTSRGSEAALLLAANYENILGNPPGGAYANLGVMANVPSSNVVCGITAPVAGESESTGYSAWTVAGADVPFDDPAKKHNPAAEIPVEQITGPIFLDCGWEDNLWNSCESVRAIRGRLKSRGSQNPHVEHREYRRGGHGLGVLVAYLPRAFSATSPGPKSSPVRRGARVVGDFAGWVGSLAYGLMGKYPSENRIIDGDLWPKLLAFLGEHS